VTYFINVLFLDIGILQNLLDGLHRLVEKDHLELVKLGASKGFGEVTKYSIAR
jgi:hypothetical protein